MAEVEVWILLVSVIFMLLGLAGGISKLVVRKELRVFKYLLIIGAIGILLFPISILVASINGRTSAFLEALALDPTGLLGSIGGKEKYSSVCTNGHCAKYCCRDIQDDSVTWKDCDKQCNSVEGITGVEGSADCMYAEIPMYCTLTGQGGKVRITDSACNNIEELGPITCTCCSNESQSKWWDCNANCSSASGTAGFPLSVASCKGVTAKQCNKGSKEIDSTNNVQEY